MFIHNFKYAFKTLFRNKMLLFWTYAFPIILGTFFYMAFSNIENSEKLDIIDIAIVDNEAFQNHPLYKEAFQSLSDEENENRLFHTQYVTEEEAKQQLQEKEIIGYMLLEEDTPKVVIATNGINETIFQYVTEEIVGTSEMMHILVEQEIQKEATTGKESIDYEALYTNMAERIQNQKANIENITSNHLSYTMIEYYTLIAMACLYGGILGMVAINQNLANMTSKRKKSIGCPHL